MESQDSDFLNFKQVDLLFQKGAKIIDTRNKHEFVQGYIQGSYNIQFGEKLGTFIQKLFRNEDKFIIICEQEKEKDILNIFRENKLNNQFLGFFRNGIKEWKLNKQNKIISSDIISENEFADFYKKADKSTFQILDVRNKQELETEGYIQQSKQIPLFDLEQQLQENQQLFDRDKCIYVFCKSGYRANIGLSILAKYDFKKVVNFGGMDGIKKTDIPVKLQ